MKTLRTNPETVLPGFPSFPSLASVKNFGFIFAFGLILLSAFWIDAAEMSPAVKSQAQEFPLSAVKLLDGPFRQAMEVDRAFLLRIDPDRLLAGFRVQAGLPKKAEPYRGWEEINPTNRYT